MMDLLDFACFTIVVKYKNYYIDENKFGDMDKAETEYKKYK